MVVARSSANSASRNGDVEATVSPDGEGTDGSVGTGYDCLNLYLGLPRGTALQCRIRYAKIGGQRSPVQT